MAGLSTLRFKLLIDNTYAGIKDDEILEIGRAWFHGESIFDVEQGSGKLMTRSEVNSWIKENLFVFFDAIDWILDPNSFSVLVFADGLEG